MLEFRLVNFNLPLSLSLLSLQFCSRATAQSTPSHPSEQRHSHIPSPLTRHCPWFEQPDGHPSNVQCLPFQPVTQRHVPFLHWPCSLQRESHNFVLQRSPPQPSSHIQALPIHFPCWPQSSLHNSVCLFKDNNAKKKNRVNKLARKNKQYFNYNTEKVPQKCMRFNWFYFTIFFFCQALTYPLNNRHQSSSFHICKFVYQNQIHHDYCNLANMHHHQL